MEQWPEDFEQPNPGTLWRWLQRAVDLGLVHRDGTGRRNAPFRYWLPGQEEKWMQNPLYRVHLMQEQARERLREMQDKLAGGAAW